MNKQPWITFVIDGNTKRAMERKAVEMDLTLSQLMRSLIRDFLEKELSK